MYTEHLLFRYISFHAVSVLRETLYRRRKMKSLVAVLAGVMAAGSMAFADAKQDYAAGVEKWNNLKGAQNKPCDPSVDSQEVLTGHKTAIAVLVLHGYAQNPQAMADYIGFFKRYDVNIIAPRLAHHFDADMKALDRVNAQQ